MGVAWPACGIPVLEETWEGDCKAGLEACWPMACFGGTSGSGCAFCGAEDGAWPDAAFFLENVDLSLLNTLTAFHLFLLFRPVTLFWSFSALNLTRENGLHADPCTRI